MDQSDPVTSRDSGASYKMRSCRPAVCGLLFVLSAAALAAQGRIAGFIDPMPTARLRQLFPDATTFSPRGDRDPLYFTAYAGDPSRGAPPLGYAFWTIDLVPGYLAYHGHIHMLIGMNTSGRLTGVIVDRHTEPYGDISIELPEFPDQFKGKSIRDPFAIGEDVDVISRATITTRAAAREIRDSARMVAKAVLRPQDVR